MADSKLNLVTIKCVEKECFLIVHVRAFCNMYYQCFK